MLNALQGPGAPLCTLYDAHGTAYYEAGSGAPVLLLHGVGLTAGMWQPVMQRLAARWRVIAPDMLGHGRSPLPSRDVCLAEYARQSAALLGHLGIRKATVVGFSMGALVAQRLALDFPDLIDKAAFVSGVYRRSLEEKLAVAQRALTVAIKGVEPSIEPALRRWFGADFRARYPEMEKWVRETMLANDPVGYLRSYATFATADDEMAEDLTRMKAPALVITGSEDAGSTPAMARGLQERLPDARLEIVPGARHLLPLEMPECLCQLLQEFMSDTTP